MNEIKEIGLTNAVKDIARFKGWKYICFSPKGKRFIFKMDTSCYWCMHRVCPIKEHLRDKKCRCNEILDELERYNFKQHGDVVSIIYNEKDNFYKVGGQHRMCMAYQLGLDIWVKDEGVNNNLTCDGDLRIGF